MNRPHRIARASGVVVLLLLAGLAAEYVWAMHTGIDSWGRGQGTQPYTYYPTSGQLNERMESLAAHYPDLVTVQEIGRTLQGKPLFVASIAAPGRQASDGRPALLVIAQQHGREAIASQVALYSIEHLLKRYDTDPLVKHLLASRTIYYVPQANPDGNDIFLSTDSSHRGNARPTDLDGDGQFGEDGRDNTGAGTYTRHVAKFTDEWIRQTGGNVFASDWNARDEQGRYKNARGYWTLGFVNSQGFQVRQFDNDDDGRINEDDLLGVDLNRNWGVDWEQGVSDPGSLTYKGSMPFSEPETAAIRGFVLSHQNIVASVEFHSGADVILMPWSRTRDELPPDLPLLDQLARKSSQLTDSPHAVAGQGLYVAFGTIKDWLYTQGILTLVPEVYAGSYHANVKRLWPTGYFVAYGSSAQQFNPPPRDIQSHGERWRSIVPYLLSTLPEPYAANFHIANGALCFTVGNAGFIGSNLHLSLYRQDEEILRRSWSSASETAETITIPVISDGSYRLVLSSQPDIKVRQRQSQELVISFQVSDLSLLGLDESAAPPELSRLFDGYTAPEDPWESMQWHKQHP